MDPKRTYEGMFLMEAGNPDFQAASEPIRNVLDRAKAEVLSLKPWEERRLAYQIRGHRRGLYVLTYFKADPSRITEIEHDCELDERILRVMFLRREHITDDRIHAETPATKAAGRVRKDHPSPAKSPEAQAPAPKTPQQQPEPAKAEEKTPQDPGDQTVEPQADEETKTPE